MKLTPLDIHHKEFRRAIRGYNEEDVDVFLDEVAEEFERLFKENIELREKLEKTKEQIRQYEGIEDTLQKTLLTAQKSADQVKAQAQKEAEMIVRDAEVKSRETLQDIIRERDSLQHSFNDLKKAEQDFRMKFRSLLESFITMVNEIEGGMEPKMQVESEEESIEQQPNEEAEDQLTRLLKEIKIAKNSITKEKEIENFADESPVAAEEIGLIAEDEERTGAGPRAKKRGMFKKKKSSDNEIQEIS